jgi:hypothetical protein
MRFATHTRTWLLIGDIQLKMRPLDQPSAVSLRREESRRR